MSHQTVKTLKTVSAIRKRTFKSRLQSLRHSANLRIRETSAAAGISSATLSRLERGGMPDIVNALRLARFYETSVEYLFGHFLIQQGDR